ncbi:hypothetical protein Avbf_05976 [Armadillidium vulgare]|nr:hypothetical protein Avbf_05976 [Armadillidium vulgare]
MLRKVYNMEQGIKLENIANDSLDYVEGYIEEEPLDIKVEKEDCYNSSAEKDVFEAEETSVGNFCWNLDYLKINTIKEETIEDSEMLQNSYEIDAIDSKVTLNSNFVVDTSTSDTYEEILPPNAGRMRSCRKLGYKKSKKSQKHGKLFSCSKCEYTAIKFAYLKVHEAIHSDERPYQCLKCDYTSKYSSNFSQHKKKYHSEGKRNLGIRKKKLRKRKKLFTAQKKEKSPLSVDDDVEREKFEYDFEETTDSSSDLKFSRTHKQISKCVEKGKCKSKSLSENLKESHNEYKIGSSDSDIRTLSPVEEYKIDNLSKPALVDEKLNQSKTCEYSTAKRASLVDHEFLHTGKKYYRCLKCNFSFKNRFSLYRHKKLCNTKNTKDKCFTL